MFFYLTGPKKKKKILGLGVTVKCSAGKNSKETQYDKPNMAPLGYKQHWHVRTARGFPVSGGGGCRNAPGFYDSFSSSSFAVSSVKRS